MRLRMDAGQLRAWLPQTQRDALVQRLDSTPIRETQPSVEDLFMTAVGAPQDLTFDWAPPPPASAPVEIRAEKLVRRFGDFTAVDHVSLQVRAGEIFGLLGANGAGKSTLIHMLTGILPPTEGSGEVAGQPLGKASRQVRQRIGYMSQQFSLYPQLSVLENLRLFGRIYGLRRRQLQQRIEWGLDWTGLVTDKNEAAGRLPLGKRQRLALLAAILHEPEVLFLDEPTSGVDPLGRQQFWGLLHTLVREEGVALLVTTHAMNEAENCHNLALMRQGRVVASGSPRQLRSMVRSRFGQVYALRVDDTARALATLRQRGWLAFAQGREVHVFVAGDDAALGRLKAQLEEACSVIRAIERVEPTMEEVFVSMIEGTA
jgi:ABC-2 type transport system ATP-binding protein